MAAKDPYAQAASEADGEPTVLYIGGFGRSGSTLVERVLEASPLVASLGEVVHLWTRGLLEDELCECGTRFSECSFWSAVGDRAFGGWRNVDVAEVLALQSGVDRQRHVFRTLRPTRAVREQIARYTDYYRAVYEAAAKVSGAQIIVDSSKHASLAIALRNDRGIRLRVLHLVRDSVAVAYSWSKEVSRPETQERGDRMTRYSAITASTLWMSNNILVQLLRLSRTRVHRLRYEDFVRSPTTALQEMWQDLSLPGEYELELSVPGGVRIDPGHSIGGNPMRFRKGSLIIQADEAWRRVMPARQRRLVKTLTVPVRAWLGYTRAR